MTRAVREVFEDGARAARRLVPRRAAGALTIVVALSLIAAAARAESFVLVYSEGSVVTVPGGITVAKGEEIDSQQLLQLGPADQAIFISQSGNIVHHDGPYCGPVAGSAESTGSGGLLAPLFRLFGGQVARPTPQGCPK